MSVVSLGRFTQNGIFSNSGFLSRVRNNIIANRGFLKRRFDNNATIDVKVLGWRYMFIIAMVVVLTMVVLDEPIGNYRADWPQPLKNLARAFTDIGKSGWILAPSGVFMLGCYCLDWGGLQSRTRLLFAKLMAVSSYIFLSVGISGLLASSLKYAIGRGRPFIYDRVGAFEFRPFSLDAAFASFPSGHSTTAGALFAGIAIFFPALRFPALILGVWLAFSRVLVGVHYPSHVIAGVALGAWYAYFQALVFARYGVVFTTDSQGWPIVRKDYYLFRPQREIG